MVESTMMSSRIHVVGQTQLIDTSQPLKNRMFYQTEYQRRGDMDESVNRIIDYFSIARQGNKLKAIDILICTLAKV